MVPALTPSQQQELAAGRVSLDDLTRRFVRDHLTYRFVVTADGAEAAQLEVEVRRGALLVGETVSESPVATEAPLTSKVTISGWSTKRLKGRRNIFLNQPTDLTLGEGQRGEDRATLRRHGHAPGRR